MVKAVKAREKAREAPIVGAVSVARSLVVGVLNNRPKRYAGGEKGQKGSVTAADGGSEKLTRTRARRVLTMANAQGRSKAVPGTCSTSCCRSEPSHSVQYRPETMCCVRRDGRASVEGAVDGCGWRREKLTGTRARRLPTMANAQGCGKAVPRE